VVSTPNRAHPRVSELFAVSAAGPSDVWAVGDWGFRTGHTFVLHWNGVRWAMQDSPNAGVEGCGLLAVTALPGTKEVWAAGAASPGFNRGDTLIEHHGL
jgi:hypothetical protein